MSTGEKRLLAAYAVLFIATWWRSPYPAEQALHHSLTLVALMLLAVVRRHYALPFSSFLLILAFLALHTLAARWIYSYVPYDQWTQAIMGFRLSELFGWHRNHFDRLVHLAYGACLAPLLFRYLVDVRGWQRGWAAACAVEIVISTSALYELFEWCIAMTLASGAVEAYNGQQGDAWDAHRDMALALTGALAGAAIVAVRARRRQPAQ
jgi:putative membrane protein